MCKVLPHPSLWEIRTVKLIWQADDTLMESTFSTRQRGGERGLCYGKCLSVEVGEILTESIFTSGYKNVFHHDQAAV